MRLKRQRLSWACLLLLFTIFAPKGIIILTPTKRHESHEGPKRPQKKTQKSLLLLLLELIFVPNSCTKEYWNNMTRVSWVQVVNESHTHTHTHTHTRVAMAYAHKPNLYNNTECAPCGKCAWGYVIVCSSLVRCASLQHCIAFNVFHVLFWFTLHSVVFHHKFKLGYFTTSIIGHNVHIIFIVLWNNCWVFVCYPKQFIHLLISFVCYPKTFIHLLISFVCYPKKIIHLLIFFVCYAKNIIYLLISFHNWFFYKKTHAKKEKGVVFFNILTFNLNFETQ
jgi:hypothetical protein